VGVDCLKGKVLTRVYKHYPGNFTFEFDVATLAVDCLWRLRKNHRVSLTSNDDGQKFGLLAPVDACLEAASLLNGQHIIEVTLNESSADLTLQFDDQIQLEVLTDSSGY
jgi:hypothetical protein